MNRQDRDHHDYGRYDGYNNDEHYHSARNLTDEFEREYERRHGGQSDYNRDSRNRIPQSYHEGNDVENTYQRLRRNEDSFRDRTDYSRNNQNSDRNYSGNFGRADDNQNNYRGNMGMYRSGQDSYQGQNDRPMRSDNAGPYNPYNSNNYSRTRDQQDTNSGLGDGYRGSRYGGNSDYLGNQQAGSYSNSDRSYRNSNRSDNYRNYSDRDNKSGDYSDTNYSGGTSYSGPYGSNEDVRYSRDRDRNNDDSWFGSSYQRNRYY